MVKNGNAKVVKKPVKKTGGNKTNKTAAVKKEAVVKKNVEEKKVCTCKKGDLLGKFILVACMIAVGFSFGYMIRHALDKNEENYNNAPVASEGEEIVLMNYCESAWSTLYLDTNGNVYYHLDYNPTMDDEAYDALMALKEREEQYIDGDEQEISAIKLNQEGIYEIYYADDDNNGYGYFGLLDAEGSLVLINEADIINNGEISYIRSSILKNIIYVGVEVDDVNYTLSAYALNDDYEKIYLNGIEND